MFVVLFMIGLLALAAGSALAAPNNIKFNWGNQVNLSKCDKGKLVVNISHDVINSVDSRVGGGFRALINYRKHIQTVQTGEGTFCVVTKYIGKFETLEGRSPANQEDISAGITGTLL